jgi:hypothetical protein
MTKEQLRCLKKIRTHLLKDNPPDQQMAGGLDNIINEYDMFNRPIDPTPSESHGGFAFVDGIGQTELRTGGK